MPLLSSLAKNLKQVAYNLSDLEMKTLEATNTDPWGPHGTAMFEIASACVNHEGFGQVFTVLKKRMALQGESWRQVYKALLVIEYMIKHCPRFVVEHIKDESTTLRRLKYFQYKSPDGRDQGINVRTRAETLLKLLSDGDMLNDERAKAKTATRKLAKGFSRDEQTYYKNSPTSYRQQPQYGGGSSSFNSSDNDTPSTGLDSPVTVNISSSVNQGATQRAKTTLSQTKVNSKISATFSNYSAPAAKSAAPAPTQATATAGGNDATWADFAASAPAPAAPAPAPANNSTVDLLGGLDVPQPQAQAPVPVTTAGDGNGNGNTGGFDAFQGAGQDVASQGGFADFSAAPPAAPVDPFAQQTSAVEAAFNSSGVGAFQQAPAGPVATQPQPPAQPQPQTALPQSMFSQAPAPSMPQQNMGAAPQMMHHMQQPQMMMGQPQMMMQQPNMMMMGQHQQQPNMMMMGQHQQQPQMMMMGQHQQQPQMMMMGQHQQQPQMMMGQHQQQPQMMMQQAPNMMQSGGAPPPSAVAKTENTPTKPDPFADLLG